MLNKLKDIWDKLTDDGSICWEQVGLNENGKIYIYDVTMKPNKEDSDLYDLVVKLDGEIVGDKIGFTYKGDQDIDSTVPIDYAQVIINNYERVIKLKMFLTSKDYKVNWLEHKKVSGTKKKDTMTIQYYGQEVEEDDAETA